MTTASAYVQGQVRHKAALQHYAFCRTPTPELKPKRRQIVSADVAVIKATCRKIFVETVTCVMYGKYLLRQLPVWFMENIYWDSYLCDVGLHHRQTDTSAREIWNKNQGGSETDEAASCRKVITQTLFIWWHWTLSNERLYGNTVLSYNWQHCFIQHVSLDCRYSNAAIAAITVFCESGSTPLKPIRSSLMSCYVYTHNVYRRRWKYFPSTRRHASHLANPSFFPHLSFF
jgi:hypothetical protein